MNELAAGISTLFLAAYKVEMIYEVDERESLFQKEYTGDFQSTKYLQA